MAFVSHLRAMNHRMSGMQRVKPLPSPTLNEFSVYALPTGALTHLSGRPLVDFRTSGLLPDIAKRPQNVAASRSSSSRIRHQYPGRHFNIACLHCYLMSLAQLQSQPDGAARTTSILATSIVTPVSPLYPASTQTQLT